MKRTHLAIVSNNRRKYSETFIHSHLKYLSDNTLFLFNGYLPSSYSIDNLQTEKLINKKKHFWKKKATHPDFIAKLLLEKNVSVVLAEYGPSGVEMLNICKNVDIPLIVHFHGYDAYRNDILESYGTRYPELFEQAAAIVVVSRDMNEQLIKLGCPECKIKLITYGIETEVFSLSKSVTDKVQFVSCGRFVPKKGPFYTIKAFSILHHRYPDATLVMIGDGELLDECKNLVDTLKLNDNVIFTGALSQNEIAGIFASSRGFVQHSIVDERNDSEGTPLAIMEAGAAELPVVATFHAGIPDIIQNEVNGFLVNEKDVDAMAEKMLEIVENPLKAREMAARLKLLIHEKYSMKIYIDQLKKLIEEVKKQQ